jgi:hypothetical protein
MAGFAHRTTPNLSIHLLPSIDHPFRPEVCSAGNEPCVRDKKMEAVAWDDGAKFHLVLRARRCLLQ